MSRIQQLEALIAQQPNESFLFFALAKEFEKLGEYDKAIAHYESIIHKNPEYIGAYYHLGKAYELVEQPEKALAIYQQGMRIAEKIQDLHSLAELKNANTNLELDW